MTCKNVESVSIITPAFHQGPFIEAAMRSVVEQRGNFDIDYIVVDGGSTDGTVERIKEFERRLQIGEIKPGCRGMRFRWLSEKDSGQASAINKGFRLATGDVFAWLNSDDTYADDQAIAKCVRFFRRHADSRFLYGKGFATDREGRIRGEETRVTDQNVEVLPEIDMILQPAAFWRREVYETVGPLDESLRYVLDWEYWLRCQKHFRLDFLDEFLACKRRCEPTQVPSGGIARKREIAQLLLTAGNFTQRAIQSNLIESATAHPGPKRRVEQNMMRRFLAPVRYVEKRVRHTTKSLVASIRHSMLPRAKQFTRSLRFTGSLGVYRISSLFGGRTRTRLVKWAYHLEERNVLALRDWVLRDPVACDIAIPQLLEWVGSILHNVHGRVPEEAIPGLLRSAESSLVNPTTHSVASENDETRTLPPERSQEPHEQAVSVPQPVATDGADDDDLRRGALCACAAAEANPCGQPRAHPAEQLAFVAAEQVVPQPACGLAQETRRFEPGPRDVYLASYPRSGNTWLRAVIAEMMFGESGNGLSDLDYLVPDIYQLPPVDAVRPADWHVVKTHEAYQHGNRENFKRVIYILRDPRDVVCSYYRYVKTLKQYDASFDQFLADWLAGRIWPGLWREHVMSWGGSWHGTPQTTIKILRYEDLLSDLENGIRAIGQFLGYPLDPSQLNTVIRRTMPDEMRRKESAGMRMTERADGVLYFVGQAKANVRREALTDRQQSLIADHLGDCMKRFGYEC